MIADKEIESPFQFIGNRVNRFNLETKMVDTKGMKISINFDMDYKIKECVEGGEKYFGIIEFLANGKAKAGKNILFKFELAMEGAFAGNPDTLSYPQFQEMLEMNGLITLSHISRSYLISVTSQSGINPPIKLPMININVLRETHRRRG